MATRVAWILPVTLLAAGCVRATVVRLDEVPRPVRSLDVVELLVEAPERPYTVIALIEAKTDLVFERFDHLRRRLAAEAARLGGDAVIVGDERRESTILITATAQIHSQRKRLAGEVIVYAKRGR